MTGTGSGRHGHSGWRCRWPGTWSRRWPPSTAPACGRSSCAAPTSTPATSSRSSSPAGTPWPRCARRAPSGPGCCAPRNAAKAGTWTTSRSSSPTRLPRTSGQLITGRAEAQEVRDLLAAEGLDTAELDERIGELDQQITDAGMRGTVLPARPRRHRSTRRRQDAAPLPRRPVSPRTVGKTYTAPDGKTFRPVDVRHADLPELRPGHRGRTPADPDTYDYQPRRPGRAALRRAVRPVHPEPAPVRRLRPPVLRRHRTAAAARPARAHRDPRHHLPRRAPRGHRRDLPPGLVALHQRPSSTTATACRSGTSTPGPTSTRTPAKCSRPGTRPSTPSATRTSRSTWPGSAQRFDAQGVLAGSRDASRCIGYLTKYLTKHLGDCHQASTDAQADHAARLADALRYEPCSPTCANWLRYGIQPKNARPGLRPGALQGQGPPPRVPRLRRATRPGLPQVVRQDAGRPPRRPAGLAAVHARCFGNRPGSLHLGARQARRPGPHAQRPAAAACRGRPPSMANGTGGGQAQSSDSPGR